MRVAVRRRLPYSGATVRLVLEPLPERRVRIVEYARRSKGSTKFYRQRAEEGYEYAFAQLGLSKSWEQVFGEEET